jgi:ABC-type glutathione transport system ATPase component
MTDEGLVVSNVTRLYRTERRLFGKAGYFTAVDDVSFALAPGDTLGIVGESGSGKSTLGRIAAGIDRQSSGHVSFRGETYARIGSAAWRRQRQGVQFVFQNPAGAVDPRLTIYDQVAEALSAHEKLPRAECDRRVMEMLDLVGLASLAHRVPQQLSGGQLQRAVIARALIMRPQLLICDEAVSALDVSVQAQIINLLVSLREQLGLSMIFITHDLSVARHISRNVAVMNRGRIVEMNDAATLFAAPQHDYTRKLLAAIPASSPAARRARDAALAKAASTEVSL